MNVISAVNLCKAYGKKVCVSGLSFELGENCVLGFIGPNGAGKTTTMRMLCGIMPPSSGNVFIDGIDMVKEPIRAKGITGYLPENAPLNSGMTVAGFLHYCGSMRCLSGKELRKACRRVTEVCDLSSVLQEEVDSLSKGFRRRVCLAQAIMHSPKALVLDEPTDGLDPNQKREIRTLIRNLSQHSAVIVSTHILEEIDAVCDRVLTIRNGCKVFDGSVCEFRKIMPEKRTAEISFTTENPEEAEKVLRSIPELNFSVAEKKSGELKIVCHGEDGEENPERRVISECGKHNWEILSVRTKEAGLDEVFSRLVSHEEEC